NFRYQSTVNFGDFQQLALNFGKSSSLAGAEDLVRSKPEANFGKGRIAPEVDAPTVTLNIAASGGSWTAYANASTGDNAGIASFDIDVAGSGGLTVNTSFNDAPADSKGFVEFPSNGNNDTGSGGDGISITAGQDTFGTGKHSLFQGFGQTSGTDGTVSWTQTDSGVDIASGTYSGTSGTLTVDVDGDGYIQTLDIVNNGYWYGPENIEDATVYAGSVTIGGGDDAAFEDRRIFGDSHAVPEPGSGIILLGAATMLFRRRRTFVKTS
ncbi:MAG TPA: PEP-CTERM sorting domain-containing protein, partial [Tepidisphaeraceae bacterium]|nr:PEP-CTERM sorting domain-containing protein [Tepidisphaeraceae bacterium]